MILNGQIGFLADYLNFSKKSNAGWIFLSSWLNLGRTGTFYNKRTLKKFQFSSCSKMPIIPLNFAYIFKKLLFSFKIYHYIFVIIVLISNQS